MNSSVWIKVGVGILLLTSPLVAGNFQAAATKIDITPENDQWLLGYPARKSEKVHDRLYHRIVAMQDGEKRLVLISTDLAGISPSFYDDFCAELKQETGLEKEQVWWTVTHTHAAPEVGQLLLAKVFLGDRFNHEWDRDYTNRVTRTLKDGIKEVLSNLVPARLGIGKGLSLANMNRRARDADGTIKLGLDPEAPVDRQIGLIRLETVDGSLIALIANYAMHGTVLGGVRAISGDAPGIVASYVEQKLGAPMLYINGAAGNITPIYFFNMHFNNLSRFNVLLGDRILEANRLIQMRDGSEVGLDLGTLIVETPKKPGIEWPDSLSDYHRKTSTGVDMVRIPVRFFKIANDTVLWAAPLELFCEVAIRVRNQSPFANTFYFGYTNGWMGYLPTKQAFQEGGYEPSVSPFTDQAEQDLGDAVIVHLQGMGR